MPGHLGRAQWGAHIAAELHQGAHSSGALLDYASGRAGCASHLIDSRPGPVPPPCGLLFLRQPLCRFFLSGRPPQPLWPLSRLPLARRRPHNFRFGLFSGPLGRAPLPTAFRPIFVPGLDQMETNNQRPPMIRWPLARPLWPRTSSAQDQTGGSLFGCLINHLPASRPFQARFRSGPVWARGWAARAGHLN